MKRKSYFNFYKPFTFVFLQWAMVVPSGCGQKTTMQRPLLKVVLTDSPTLKNVLVSNIRYDTGGNTSLANDAALKYKWSGKTAYATNGFGYFNAQNQEIPYMMRNRDLGQTFKYSGSVDKALKSVTVQLGFGSNVVRTGMYSQHISVQILEVSGTPVVNDNGSDNTMKAFHGWPNDRLHKYIEPFKDDYITGETYHSLGVFSGATFPTKTDFGFAENDTDISPGNPKLKGWYLQFVLPKEGEVILKPGKEYAFMLMIDSIGDNRGFTLANKYEDVYPFGHGIRRGGNGVFPPTPADPSKNFTDPANKAALASTRFPVDMKKRAVISPGTNGYPDVDTRRDLVFFIQAE
ncbi:MAG: hypothetical protein ABI683_08075 [Ginsengibacter sp.]